MTQIAAIAKALLDGEVLSIMNGFKKFSCTNLPRELSRSIEQKFGVQISKTQKDFTSEYGQRGWYYQYRLNKTPYNADGIKKMEAYVKEHCPKAHEIKTDRQAKALKSAGLTTTRLF